MGCWLMNEGSGNRIYDLSNNGNHGFFATPPSWVPGRSGPALFFDGDNDYINAGNDSSLDITTAFSASFWLRRTAVTLGYALTKHGVIGDETEASYGIRLDASDNAWIQFWIVKSTVLTNVNFDADALNDTISWHHVGITWDNAVAKCYVDGLDINDDEVLVGPADVDVGDLLIGYLGREATTFLHAELEQLQIYNRVLSANEIAWLYSEPYAISYQPSRSKYYFVPAAVGANAPTGALYGPLVGPLGGPV